MQGRARTNCWLGCGCTHTLPPFLPPSLPPPPPCEQAHGGAGVSQDTMLARLWTHARTLRIADGPDEVHLATLAKLELKRSRL